MTPSVARTPGLQPTMVPSSVAKRKLAGPAVPVDARQRRLALGQEDAVSVDVVFVHDLHMRDPHDRGLDGQEVIVVGRLLELAADLHDHQEMAGVLDLTVRTAA